MSAPTKICPTCHGAREVPVADQRVPCLRCSGEGYIAASKPASRRAAVTTWPQTMRIGSEKFRVQSLADASRVYCAERDASGEGASTFPRGRVGRYDISYNGQVWLNGKAVEL